MSASRNDETLSSFVDPPAREPMSVGEAILESFRTLRQGGFSVAELKHELEHVSKVKATAATIQGVLGLLKREGKVQADADGEWSLVRKPVEEKPEQGKLF